jgi:hypothetical protein
MLELKRYYGHGLGIDHGHSISDGHSFGDGHGHAHAYVTSPRQ